MNQHRRIGLTDAASFLLAIYYLWYQLPFMRATFQAERYKYLFFACFAAGILLLCAARLENCRMRVRLILRVSVLTPVLLYMAVMAVCYLLHVGDAARHIRVSFSFWGTLLVYRLFSFDRRAQVRFGRYLLFLFLLTALTSAAAVLTDSSAARAISNASQRPEAVARDYVLMLSSYAANFLVGSGKMVIQWRWGLLVFGKVSLAFSLTSFFLQFVTAISVVLFPSIKRMEPDKLPGMYCRIRQGISPLLFAAMLLYYPGCVLLRLWLPKYEASVSYLGMLLPLIIYTSKVSLLTNNYLKAYQQERTMLRINASCVAAGLALFALGAWVLNSLTAVLLLVLLSVMLRSMLSEAAVMRIIHVDLRREFVIEFALTAVFLISTCMLPYWWGLGVYGAALGGYLLGKRRDLRQLAHTLRRT